MTKRSSARLLGFTIVELLVVIVVIGVLASIVVVGYTGVSQKATVATLKSDLANAKRQYNAISSKIRLFSDCN